MIILVFGVVMCRVDNNVHKHCDCCTATRSLLGSMRGWRPLIEVLSQLKFRDHPTAGAGPVQGREDSCPPDLKSSDARSQIPGPPPRRRGRPGASRRRSDAPPAQVCNAST